MLCHLVTALSTNLPFYPNNLLSSERARLDGESPPLGVLDLCHGAPSSAAHRRRADLDWRAVVAVALSEPNDYPQYELKATLAVFCSYLALHIDCTFRRFTLHLKCVAGKHGATVEPEPDSFFLVGARDVRDTLALSRNGICS